LSYYLVFLAVEVLIYWWLFFSRKEHLQSYPIETFVVGRLIGVPVNRTPPAYCASTCSQYTFREPNCNCIFLAAEDIIYPETEERAIYVTTHIRYLINQNRSQYPHARLPECQQLNAPSFCASDGWNKTEILDYLVLRPNDFVVQFSLLSVR
jgi:hypothetical protein